MRNLQGPIIRPIIKSVMPSSIAISGGDVSYGQKRRTGGGSHPGLMTIGGGSYAGQIKGKWSRMDSSTPGGSRITDEQYGVTNLEMKPRTTVTVISANRHSPDLVDSRIDGHMSNGVSAIQERGSDEFPIMGGIKQTVQVEWRVESINPKDR